MDFPRIGRQIWTKLIRCSRGFHITIMWVYFLTKYLILTIFINYEMDISFDWFSSLFGLWYFLWIIFLFSWFLMLLQISRRYELDFRERGRAALRIQSSVKNFQMTMEVGNFYDLTSPLGALRRTEILQFCFNWKNRQTRMWAQIVLRDNRTLLRFVKRILTCLTSENPK